MRFFIGNALLFCRTKVQTWATAATRRERRASSPIATRQRRTTKMTTTTRNKSRTIKIKMKVKGWTTKVTHTKIFEFFLKIFKLGTTILWIGPKLSEKSLTSDSILKQISRVPQVLCYCFRCINYQNKKKQDETSLSPSSF